MIIMCIIEEYYTKLFWMCHYKYSISVYHCEYTISNRHMS